MIRLQRLFSASISASASALILILATIVFSSAAFAQSTPAKPTNARDISIGLQAAITSMDPHYHNIGPNNSMLRHIFESLTTSDENGKLTPALAVSWKLLNDTTWEFKLRKNVRVHDGSPFTADDVAFTLKRVPNVPNSPSSFATFTKPIIDVKIVDSHTIVFKTATPHVLLPSDLSQVLKIGRAHV